MKIKLSAWTSLVALFLCSCGDSVTSNNSSSSSVDCKTLAAGQVIVMVSPVGNENYKVGQSVTVTWKEDPSKLSGVLPQVSKDGGKTWGQSLADSSLEVSAKSIDCYNYTWVIQASDVLDSGATSNNEVQIRIRDYNDVTLNGTSGNFTVSQ